ncbi:lysozyme-like domain-containing protein [Cladochytrium replicatum]|nr:lysozyme-like domain-containing protein [Cladochytrium replicatum]
MVGFRSFCSSLFLCSTLAVTLALTADVDQCEKSIIQQLTNYYENERFQYVFDFIGVEVTFSFDYCENIHDGRGYTAGIAGFTTGTHDALEVIQLYVKKMNGRPSEFDGMLNRLKDISRSKSGLNADVAGLDSYCKAWEKACANTLFREAQMESIENKAWIPSQNMADKLGLNLTISRGFLYDGWIMQGSGDDHDSMEAIISRAQKAVGSSNTYSDSSDELAFLRAVFRERYRVFTNPADSATKSEWTAAVPRLYSYYFLYCTGQTRFKDSVLALDLSSKTLNVTCDPSIEDRFVPLRHSSKLHRRGGFHKRAAAISVSSAVTQLKSWMSSDDHTDRFCEDVLALAKVGGGGSATSPNPVTTSKAVGGPSVTRTKTTTTTAKTTLPTTRTTKITRIGSAAVTNH